jgi:hypothetical protein
VDKHLVNWKTVARSRFGIEGNTSMSLRKLVPAVLALTLLGVLGTAGVANAQTYGGGAVVTVSPSVAAPCSTVAVSGTGFPASSAGTVTVGGTTVPITTTATGTFSQPVTIPCTASGVLGVTVRVGTVTGTGSVTISGTTPITVQTVTSGSLPVTGNDSASLLVRVGILLILSGGAVVLVSIARQRRRNSIAA